MQKIMIIEDAPVIREELQVFLTRYGYEVEAPSEFTTILEQFTLSRPQLILLDINLPVFDGYYLCKEIRKISEVPIIVVTSRDSELDELMSMNLGADDFVTKPYNTQILLARISSLLKRTYGNPVVSEVLTYKGLSLNLANGSMKFENQSMELTKNELKILACLLKNQGQIVSREMLMEQLWKSDLFVDDNTLSVNVTRLRRKLEEIGLSGAIETRRGLGYIMA